MILEPAALKREPAETRWATCGTGGTEGSGQEGSSFREGGGGAPTTPLPSAATEEPRKRGTPEAAHGTMLLVFLLIRAFTGVSNSGIKDAC